MRSVQEQSYTNYEHIIIDGDSTDGSKKYLDAHRSQFSYVVSEPDNGVYEAMNKGIARAQGEYLLFLNAGDHFYSKNALQEAAPHLDNENIIYFDLEVVEPSKRFIKGYPDTLSFSYFVIDTLPHPATFIRKDAFAKAGTYKEDFRILSDWKFFIDAICKCQLSYKHVPKVLSTFYLGGMSSDPENRTLKFTERAQVLENEYALYYQDIEDTIALKNTVRTFKNSRIIKTLVNLGLLNKF